MQAPAEDEASRKRSRTLTEAVVPPTTARAEALTLRQRLGWLGLLTAFWGLLALVFGAQMALFGPFTWSQALRFTFRDWYPWMILSPVVVWLARRFPLEQGHLRWSIPVHLLACAATVAICSWLTFVSGPGPDFGGRVFGQGMRRSGGQAARQPGAPPGSPAGEGERGPRPPDRGNRPPGHPNPGPFSFRMLSMRANFHLPIYCVVVSLSHAFTFFQRSRERERRALDLESRLAKAKLQALRMQLHPHFLFNTLNAISTLVHRDPVAADETIANLSELLRLAIEDPDRPETPLARELDFIARYLDIQKVRFGDRLTIEQRVDPGTLSAQVPTMILQPLVENAIRHGIEPEMGPGRVRIEAERDGDRLRLSVWDSGRGPQKPPPSGGRHGIGLANTRARLQELYFDRFRLELAAAPGGGCLAQIVLPFRAEPRAPTIPTPP